MVTQPSEDRQAALLKELNEIRKSNPLALYNLESPLLPPVHKKQLQFHAIAQAIGIRCKARVVRQRRHLQHYRA